MQNINGYVDNRSFDVEGITGEIKRYLNEPVAYPYFLIESTPDCPVQLSRLQVLANIFVTSKVIDKGSTAITVYYKDGEKVLKLGKLSPKQVKSFLRLFSGNSVTGMYDDSKVLTGEYLYVLAE